MLGAHAGVGIVTLEKYKSGIYRATHAAATFAPFSFGSAFAGGRQSDAGSHVMYSKSYPVQSAWRSHARGEERRSTFDAAFVPEREKKKAGR